MWRSAKERRLLLTGSDSMGSEMERENHSASSLSSSSVRRSSSERNPGSGTVLPYFLPRIPYWCAKRHLTGGNPTPLLQTLTPWRAPPGKLRTAVAGLVLCLNIDVDPPDIVKTNPCAILECWVDPRTMPSHKALDAISINLKHQFEGLQPRIQYRPIPDPSLEELKKNCVGMRRIAGQDAVLLYYNGHGVPKPTPSGEMWCFNKDYTQYIPVSLAEVQTWLGSPCVYVWDCSAAGYLLENFVNFARRRDSDVNMLHGGYTNGMQPFLDCIHLAACAAHEQLPSCPDLPADLFTSCLTSPIDIALRIFVRQHNLPNGITPDMVMQIPGDLKDRRTPLGELNWIFTAITDSIAWTTFSREIFTRLFRSDLLVASLFRNFLLAERIMKTFHCTPYTYPPLPLTNTHALWAAWDFAVDSCLMQLPRLLANNLTVATGVSLSSTTTSTVVVTAFKQQLSISPQKPYVYVPNRFFADQLTAFEVWISHAGSSRTRRGPMLVLCDFTDKQSGGLDDIKTGSIANDLTSVNHGLPCSPPDKLPIVLQVLLFQQHRLRALVLLAQFIDLGTWAVNLALTIGIFPYISKLLAAPSVDLRPVLIYIWARIIAVDSTCQADLYSNNGYKYFANALAVAEAPTYLVIDDRGSEHKAMSAYVLSAMVRDRPSAQNACLHEKVFDACLARLDENDFLLRQWAALCIGQLWDGNDEVKIWGVDRGAQDKLIDVLSDDSPEVRAAALFALSTFMGASGSIDPCKSGGGGSGGMYHFDERIHFRMEVAVAIGVTIALREDASPMVRKELLVFLSCLVREWCGFFTVCAWFYWEEDRKWRRAP